MAKSSTRISHCLIYSFIFGIFLFSITYSTLQLSKIKDDSPVFKNYKAFGGRAKFLTFINLVGSKHL